MAPRQKPARKRRRHFFREWREKRFPNQSAAEEALGWSQSKVSRLEGGATPYNQDDLEHAAEIYGCTPADLISRAPDQAPPSQEDQLRASLIAYGVDGSDLDQVVDIIDTFSTGGKPEETPSPAYAPLASRRRVKEPSE